MAKERAIIQNNLATVECLGITPTHIRLDSTNPEEGPKGFFSEPRPFPLAGETIENLLNLSLGGCFIQADEKVGRTQVTIVLRDLILQNEMVSERVPGELGDQAMILVQVHPIVSEDQIRVKIFFQSLEEFLDLAPLIRKEPVPIVFHNDFVTSGPFQKEPSRLQSFPATGRSGAKYNPGNLQARILVEKTQNRPATTDLDIVAVSTKAQNLAATVR